ncbi:SCO6745 family protein [Aeromicrobium panaciterrae]|uniref:SCO6745 family protein n=1 Tax=Aeromicrobium panaciterrae TaxID=363861 RepID=UPI0031DA50A3
MPTTKFWRSVEVLHDVVYFAPDAKARYEALGLKGYWMGYFASRSAPMGTPPPEMVIATFHGFAPRMVQRALPDAWSLASRDDILTARLDLARDTLAPATEAEGADTARVARELAAIVSGFNLAGKPLAAAHAALERPTDDTGLLWWAASAIREYRGDCHIAVLTAAGLDGVSANTLAVAAGLTAVEQRNMRGWTEDEWAAGYAQLASRGWVDADGTITESGRSARQQIEDATDRVCAAGMDREATGRAITVEEGLRTLARAVLKSGVVSFPNPTATQHP